MPLLTTELHSGLSAVFNPESGEFVETLQETIDSLAATLLTYCQGVVPASTTTASALVKLKADLQPLAISETLVDGLYILTTAIINYANGVGAGMVGFTYTLGTINLVSIVPIGLSGDRGAVVDYLTLTIDTYFKTGISTNISTGTTISWR